MKRLISLVIIAVVAAGGTFAQEKQVERRQRTPQQGEQREPREPREIETVTISGALKLEKGIVAIQIGDKTHLIPMLNRYIGFISGLQEGKTVSVEGFSGRNILHPKKLTIDGKEYDFSGRMLALGMPRQHAPQQRFHAPRKQHPRLEMQRRRTEGSQDRNREDRPNREERSRKQAPSGTSSLQVEGV